VHSLLCGERFEFPGFLAQLSSFQNFWKLWLTLFRPPPGVLDSPAVSFAVEVLQRALVLHATTFPCTNGAAPGCQIRILLPL
jgi:hypothetical protein